MKQCFRSIGMSLKNTKQFSNKGRLWKLVTFSWSKISLNYHQKRLLCAFNSAFNSGNACFELLLNCEIRKSFIYYLQQEKELTFNVQHTIFVIDHLRFDVKYAFCVHHIG